MNNDPVIQTYTKITAEDRTLSIATWVGIAHIISGVAIYFKPVALKVTPLHFLYDISLFFGMSSQMVAFILIFAGALAIVGSRYGLFLHHRIHILTFLPQQLLLMLQVFAITTVIANGEYPDGYVPMGKGWFILADQIWPWALSISHTLWLGALILSKWSVTSTDG